jgi:arylesterase/paraoxonase
MEVKMFKNLLFIVALVFVTKWIIDKSGALGYYQRTYNHAPGPCRKLPVIEYGSEDIQALPNGIAFISSGFRARENDLYKNRPGRIYSFDFNRPDEAPREMTFNAAPKFKIISPHGISIWTEPVTGEVYLYVISHLPVETIDKFRYIEGNNSLTHVRRIAADPNFHKLNDLVVVGDDKFFFTNYYYAVDWLEWPLGLRWASLGYFDGNRSRLIETGLSIANGLALSPNNKYLYVAHMGDGELRVYELHDNRSLTLRNSIFVNTGVDNLDVDPLTGDVWFGAHTVIHKIIKYLDDPRVSSPSQVMRVKMSADGQKATSVDEIYADDASFMSASSVAVVRGKALLIGTVAGPAFYCKMK